MAQSRATPEPLPPDPVIRAELGRVLDRVDTAVAEMVGQPDPTAPLLHDLHREGRRLGVLLRAWEFTHTTREREEVRTLARRLKRLTRLVGQVRDRDVTLALLGRAGPIGRSPNEARESYRFRARIRDEARTGRELLRVHLRTETEAGLFRALRALAERTGPRPSVAGVRRRLIGELAVRRRKVLKAHRRADERPTPQRLHDLRIRIRRLRHLEEVTLPLRLEVPSGGRRDLRALQGRLGRIHDLDLALASMGTGLARSAWASRLRELRRKERRKAEQTIARLERLLAPRPRTPRPPSSH